jgi:hypothetical protein
MIGIFHAYIKLFGVFHLDLDSQQTQLHQRVKFGFQQRPRSEM